MKELRARSKFDVRTLKMGSALHLRYRHPVFLVIRYFYLVLIPIGIVILLNADPNNRTDRVFGFLFILTGPVLFMRKYFWQYRLVQGAKSSPQAGKEVHWEFDGEGVRQHSEDHQSEFQWSGFCDRYLSPKAILLYPQKNLYFILPRDSFATQEEFEAVSKLCETKIDPNH